jgi:NAD(P)H-hydrate repair Nnr-like enzyme with NAD(P)H-hydrate dehydratase domain
MTDWTFHRDAIRAFRFVRCAFDAQTGIAQLAYAFDDGPELVETVTVPGAPFVLDAARAAAWLHARAGDVAAWRRGHEAMLATDVVGCLGK